MSTEAAILGVIAIVLSGQLLLTLQLRDRVQSILEGMKKKDA